MSDGGDLHARAVEHHDALIVEYRSAGHSNLALRIVDILELNRHAQVTLQKMKGVYLPWIVESSSGQ